MEMIIAICNKGYADEVMDAARKGGATGGTVVNAKGTASEHEKKFYGMFIAVRIGTNTAETFRHGVWYAQGDQRQRLNIVPISLAQFQRYFKMMFESRESHSVTYLERAILYFGTT